MPQSAWSGRKGKAGRHCCVAARRCRLHNLTETALLEWRAGLPEALKATAKQRTINDLKAALNAAYAVHRAELAPTVPAIIKHGLKAEQVEHDGAVPLARGNQILTD